MLQTTWWFSRNRRRMVKMSAICLVIFLCVLAVKSQLIYPANNDGQQTLQDMLHILESQKKNSDLTLSGQASIRNMLRACSLQHQGEFVVSDPDVERAYKSTLDSCKSDCLNSTPCRVMYHTNGFCFIVYKDTPGLRFLGSMFFQKVCTGIYYDVRELLGQVSQLTQIVNNLNNEVKSIREALTKANIIP